MTYALGGTDMASFSIDDGTGQLSTAIVIPDASVKASYSVRVTADDGNGGTDYVDVTITVGAAGTGTLLERYDTNPNDGIIDINEALAAIADYFAQPPLLSIGEALEVIALYFDGLNN